MAEKALLAKYNEYVAKGGQGRNLEKLPPEERIVFRLLGEIIQQHAQEQWDTFSDERKEEFIQSHVSRIKKTL